MEETEYSLPSETARLVYGQLIRMNCVTIAEEFLNVSPYMKECVALQKDNREFSTRVHNRTLDEIFNEFVTVNKLLLDIVNDETLNMGEKIYDPVEALKFIVETIESSNVGGLNPLYSNSSRNTTENNGLEPVTDGPRNDVSPGSPSKNMITGTQKKIKTLLPVKTIPVAGGKMSRPFENSQSNSEHEGQECIRSVSPNKNFVEYEIDNYGAAIGQLTPVESPGNTPPGIISGVGNYQTSASTFERTADLEINEVTDDVIAGYREMQDLITFNNKGFNINTANQGEKTDTKYNFVIEGIPIHGYKTPPTSVLTFSILNGRPVFIQQSQSIQISPLKRGNENMKRKRSQELRTYRPIAPKETTQVAGAPGCSH